MSVSIHLPSDVLNILQTLNEHGHSAYIVGGCVRDALMGKTPHDYDICTSATPEQIMSVFSDKPVLPTGLKHGTVSVGGEDDYYEITTYRVDGAYEDGRHPSSVVFVDKIEDDLSRRDFTINAMAYHPTTGIVDPFGGQQDIANRIIRCVGDPNHRFQEDALRIMRAVRFASVCGFAIESQTEKAIFRNLTLLNQVSAERKTSELCKTIVSADENLLNRYRDVIAAVIPELKATFDFEQHNYHHLYPVYQHMACAVAKAPADLNVRLALLLHDIEKPSVFSVDENGVGHFYGHAVLGEETANSILKRMRMDNATIKSVCTLIGKHDNEPSESIKYARKMLSTLGETELKRLMIVMRCDKLAQSVNPHSVESLRKIAIVEEHIADILSRNECLSLKDLAVNGNVLQENGIPSGKEMGIILNRLLQKVLSNPDLNNSEFLISEARNIYDEMATAKNL